MNKLLAVLLCYAFLACGSTGKLPSAPRVSLDFKKQALVINKRRIDGKARLFDITKALGRYNRTYEVGPHYAYFYDRWGILVLEDTVSRNISEIRFEYVLQRGQQATDGTFTADFLVGKKDLREFASPLLLQQRFPQANFKLYQNLLLRSELERMQTAVIYTDEYDPELVVVRFQR